MKKSLEELFFRGNVKQSIVGPCNVEGTLCPRQGADISLDERDLNEICLSDALMGLSKFSSVRSMPTTEAF